MVLDAFVTVSAAGVRAPRRFRERIGTDRIFIPSLMIDYVAVSRHRNGQGLGLKIFEWLQAAAQDLNADMGVRLIVLGVRAGNWGAYRRYVEDWHFTALPIPDPQVNERDAFMAPPDPTKPRPPWMGEDEVIHLYYDLVANNGPYEHTA
jgi:hypothetical protein